MHMQPQAVLLGHSRCHSRTVETLDESQHTINTGRDSRGGPELAVDDPSSMRNPLDTRIIGRDLLPSELVRRGSFAIQETGFRCYK